jgi:hypothetical protein
MIIWGSKGKETILETGDFHCPQCGTGRKYQRVKLQRYFTLYFIPLFPTKDLAEYVKCAFCQRAYDFDVLQHRPQTHEEYWLHLAKQDLRTGTPIQMVKNKLKLSGMSEPAANQMVDRVVAAGIRSCPRCSLDYLEIIRACSNCGQPI